METHFYNLNLTWNSGRIGTISSPELDQFKDSSLEVATPPEFNGGVPGIWSPEHLFVAAVLSCYMTTFLAIAENSKLEFSSFNCSSRGKLDAVDGKYQVTEIELSPELTLTNAELNDKALRILEKSEKACLISNSIKSNVVLHPKVLINPIKV